LTAEQKRIQVHMAGQLLQVLVGQVTRQWHNIVTLDEPEVDLGTEHEMMWVSPGETVPDRERQKTQSPKLMLTVGWNRRGFHVAKSLPEGTKFNSEYSVNNILIEISDWRRGAGETRPKKRWVHADNARWHTAKVLIHFLALNEIKKVFHPFYSLDLRPSDFFFSAN
jgi:hypothetical protein